MKKLLALSLLFLSACATNTTPTYRVRSAAAIPRFVDVQNRAIDDDGGGHHPPVGADAGLGVGTAWANEGNLYSGEIFHVGAHYRSEHFAAGWMPFFSGANVTSDGSTAFGSTLWGAFHFGGGNEWRFSYQNSFTSVNQITEDKGCVNATWTIFTTSCNGQPQSATRAEINVRDVGFVITAEKNLGSRGSLLIAPALHWTQVSGSSKLDVDPANDFSRTDSFWSPSLQVGYVHHLGERFRSSLAFLFGAEYAKTFRPDRVVRQWVPAADVRWQF